MLLRVTISDHRLEGDDDFASGEPPEATGACCGDAEAPVPAAMPPRLLPAATPQHPLPPTGSASG